MVKALQSQSSNISQMLLRSSSTPVLQTHFSESPNRDFDTINHSKNSQPHDHCTTKLSFIHACHHHLNLSSFSCNPSPVSQSASGFNHFNTKPNNLRRNAFRRALSDGNLEGLGSNSFDSDEFCNSNKSTRYWHKLHKTMLQSYPSFSIFSTEDGTEEGAKELESDGCLVRSVTIGDSIETTCSGEFSFGKKTMNLIQEEAEEEEDSVSEFQNLGIEEKEEKETEPRSPRMYLATGFGRIDGGGAFDFAQEGLDETGDVEVLYKRLVGEDPCNPLFLMNYAKLLQSKGDLLGAEDYCFRATLSDPEDGEILLQYAKLVWDLHHDQERAGSYFKRAAQAAPDDSHVLAAYARFLWEIEDDEEEDRSQNDNTQSVKHEDLVELQNSAFKEEKELVSSPLHQAVRFGIDVAGYGGGTDGVGFTTSDSGEDGNIEEYFKRMVHENPCNPLFLRNYGQFLHQSKGDLQGAEEYYSRAILADPGDGEIISQYAKLVWELHHDRDKATCYFERAVQATPGDSNVLAAYASFLWETEEDEEEYSAWEDNIQVSLFQAGAVTSANA